MPRTARPEAAPRPWIAPIPNVLSTARLVLALAFPAFAPAWRLPVVIVGGVTNALDGYIARRFGATSFAGGILDAIADKLFTLSVLVTLAVAGSIEPWQVGLVLVRDLAVGGVALYIVAHRKWWAFRRMVARWPGKVTTILIFAWFIVVLWPAPQGVNTGAFVLTATASAYAAVAYLRRFAAALREHSS